MAEETVVVIHLSGYETADELAVVVRLVYDMPEGFQNMACGCYIVLRGRKLEIAYLSIEGRRQLTGSERHGKSGRQGEAIDFDIGREVRRRENGAWPCEDETASLDVLLYEVEVGMNLTPHQYPHPMIVDNIGWSLLQYQRKHVVATMQDGQVVI